MPFSFIPWKRLSHRNNDILACETKAAVFSAKKTSDSRKHLCVKLANYDIAGKFWDLTEHPLQQDSGFAKYHIAQNGATYENVNELLCTCHGLPRGDGGEVGVGVGVADAGTLLMVHFGLCILMKSFFNSIQFFSFKLKGTIDRYSSRTVVLWKQNNWERRSKLIKVVLKGHCHDEAQVRSWLTPIFLTNRNRNTIRSTTNSPQVSLELHVPFKYLFIRWLLAFCL